jgi:hypothetical protein
MSRRPFAFLAAAAVVAAFAAGRAFSEDPPAGGPPADFAEMMKMWEKMKTPGPQHEVLEGFEGSWVGKGSWTDMGMTSTFTEEVTGKMIFGGRFLQVDSKMTTAAMKMGATEVPPMTMTGLMFIGFDNAKQKYVQAMVWDAGTNIGTSEGAYDAATKTFTMEGVETMGPGMQRKFRMHQKIVSADEWTFEMWFEPMGGGEMTKAGSATYTRKK